jgi:hypothetical protein
MKREILDYQGSSYQVRSVAGRVILIAGLSLGLALLAIGYLTNALAFIGHWSLKLNVAFMLFLVWLLASTGVRTVDKLLKEVEVGWLFLTGMGVGLLGHLSSAFGFWLLAKYSAESTWSYFFYVAPGLPANLAVSALVSTLTVISLRVKSQVLSIALKALLFFFLAFLIYFLM